MLLSFQFLTIPSSAQVSVFPIAPVAGVGGYTAVSCISASSQIISTEWLINGTILNDDHRSDGVVNDSRVLDFFNVSARYNNTRIQCIADSVLSITATLLVQGLLAAVGSLLVGAHLDQIHVNWTAPFTLDILTTAVDITYCVDVVSFATSLTLHSECGITETEFTYPLPPRKGCDEYNFTVTPVNVAGNGTSSFIHRPPPGLELTEVSVSTTNTTTSFFFVMTSPVCRATVTFNNMYSDDKRNSAVMTDTQLTVSGVTISGSLGLTLNSLYEVILSASNIHDIVRFEKIISTHDITDCSIYQHGEDIVVLVNFVQHTEATGALLNFVYINEDGILDFSMSFSQTIEKNRGFQNATVSLNMSYPGDYVVYAYDIERNKQVVNGLNYQASTCNFSSVSDRHEVISPSPQQNGNCSVDNINNIMYVECQSLTRFQVTAQIHDRRRVNVLHVNSSSQSIASVEVPENGEYLLTVLPIQDGTGILSGMTFSYVYSMAAEVVTTEDIIITEQFLGPSIISSREENVISDECTTQASTLLLTLLDICALFLHMFLL